MSLAYLTPKGQVVKAAGRDVQSSQNASYNISNIRLDHKGQLEEFSINNAPLSDLENTYIYVDNTHYWINEHKKKGRTGYLKKSYFIRLKNDPNKTYYEINQPEKQSVFWFDTHFESAVEGDIFSIVKVYFDPKSVEKKDFYYHKTLVQEFKIKKDNNVDFTDHLTFPTEIELDIASPNYNKRRIDVADRSNYEEGFFFKKNIQKIKESGLSDDSKMVLWRKLTSICFAIYWIRKDILEIIAMRTVAEILQATIDGTLKDQNSQQEYYFLEVDQLIGSLLEDWGYVHEDYVKEILPIPDNDNYYGGYYEAFTNYQESLDAFYHNLRNKDEKGLFPERPLVNITNPMYGTPTPLSGYALLQWRSNERIKVLKKILPSSALALLPYDFRRAIIESYIADNSMKGEEETQCLRIIHSFYLVPSEGEQFLNFLLRKRDETYTNFERLFSLFNDKFISQVSPVVGFFAQEKTNRRSFIFGLYEIWKRTKYDFRYMPEGETPNDDGVNPNAFFLTQKGLAYYQPDADKRYFNTLEFGIVDMVPKYPGDSPGIGVKEQVDTQYYVDAKLQLEKVHITRTITHNFKSVNQDGHYIGDQVGDPKSWPTEKEQMYFHLYQPLNLVGYEPDKDLSNFIAKEPLIPAFVYFYCEKYENVKDINAAWGLAIDVAIEVVFFFVTGGVSAIKDLRYLKYTSEIGKAFRGATAAEKAVLVLRAEEIGGQAFTITAAMCMSASNYIATKHDDDPAIANLAKNVGMVFFFLTMLGAGATMYARRQATNAAYKVMNDANFHTLPSEIRTVITHLTSEAEVAVATFKSTLRDLDLEKKNLFNGFVALNPDLQKAFHAEFSKMSTANLTLLNNETNAVARWSSMYNKAIEDRKILDILIKQDKVDAIVKYYTSPNPNLRKIIEPLNYKRKWDILDEIGNNINYYNRFVQDSNLLEGWIRYRYEPNFINVFSDLSANESSLFRFLQKYWNISDEAFENLKLPSVHNGKVKVTVKDKFDRLLEYPDATHHIEYFNARRAEMLSFTDSKTGDMVRLHEIDNAIELELKLGRKVRPSLNNEAGDFIDDITRLSYDAMGIPHNLASKMVGKPPKMYDTWLGYYDFVTGEGEGHLASIASHFNKINKTPSLDFVVIDYKYLDELSISFNKPSNHLKEITDQFISQNFSKYENKNLIKLNH